ncbi:DUF1697 domain-containing protein [uncultured Maribacter sp.]|uniref:DUF1697 domain-containing protein n=1 Tax=uncultured Maribacter sp. TaxID=431308 RepID=UPI0026254DC8|nr:DUF1697 domain-containing protein [uncultured Maribacter sp.]
MKTYIALLRGINVSGHKKIKMADLRLLLEKEDFTNVKTYIQSGNIIFSSQEEDSTKLEHQLSTLIKENYDFEVPVLVKNAEQIKDILDKNPYKNKEDLASNKIYFVVLKEAPKIENSSILSSISFQNEQLVITPTCVYLRCALGAGKAKCTNNFIEKKLKVSATTRNYKTMLKLQEMALI